MRLTIGSLARMSGVTVRTLRHYDALGLLSPLEVSEAGYRYYGENELLRLQKILLLKALDFPLKQIGEMLSDPHFDARDALEKQRALLLLRRDRLDRLAALIDSELKGETIMNFDAFDEKKEKELRAAYAAEARERWGNTAAYQANQTHDKMMTKQQKEARTVKMDEIFSAFARLAAEGEAPDGARADAQVACWQTFLNENFYPCTDELLRSLGEMYTADERFKQNLDRFGAGTAAFMSAAIKAHCRA